MLGVPRITVHGIPRGLADSLYVNVTGDTMTGDLLMAANVVPTTDSARTLGSTSFAWANLYVDTVQSIPGTGLTVRTGQTAAGGGPTLALIAAAAVTAGVGGAITLTAGLGVGTNAGGAITLTTGVGGVGAGGAGGALTLATAAAGAASGAAGGALILTTGAGDGAGARGVIRLDDAGAALSVLPTTTNLVSVGSTSLALAATFTNIVRPDSGSALVLQSANGGALITINNGTAGMPDATALLFGGGSDINIAWRTTSANNAWTIGTGVNSAAQSGNVILTTLANITNEHGLAAVATPRFSVFSAADMSVAGNRTQYVQMYHDGSNASLVNGVGSLYVGGVGPFRVLTEASFGTAIFRSAQNGVVAVELAQRLNTSGTPTGLLWTGGAHTSLDNASLDDWRLALNRTITFDGGGATNFAYYRGVSIAAPVLGAVTAGLSVDVASTVYIAGPPTAEDGDITLTAALALFVDAGNARFDGTILSNGGAQTICSATGNLASANGVAAFGPAGVVSITIVNGIVTAIS